MPLAEVVTAEAEVEVANDIEEAEVDTGVRAKATRKFSFAVGEEDQKLTRAALQVQ